MKNLIKLQLKMTSNKITVKKKKIKDFNLKKYI